MILQGIETVRRDNCLMVRKLVTVVLDLLLKARDPDAAVKHVKGVISELLLNRIDMSDLVVSKNLSQVRAVTGMLDVHYYVQIAHCTALPSNGLLG
jgi:DNA polymerase delta subunit 1